MPTTRNHPSGTRQLIASRSSSSHGSSGICHYYPPPSIVAVNSRPLSSLGGRKTVLRSSPYPAVYQTRTSSAVCWGKGILRKRPFMYAEMP